MSRMSFAGTGLSGLTVGILAMMSGINALSTSAYLPALPAVGADLGTSTSAVQLTLTAYLIGTAIGQLTWGPLSDATGRRRPLLVGLTCYIAASLLCSIAPTIAVLLVFRALQGWSACAGTVLSRSVVVDHAEGTRMAQLLTLLMLMGLIAPVAAPLIGAGLLLVGSWRTVFLFLAAMGVPMLLGAWWRVAESLPETDRRRGGLAELGRTVGGLLTSRRFAGYATSNASAFVAMFAFMSAAPFVFQNRLRMSAQQYAWVNAGIVSCLGVTMVLVHLTLGRETRHGEITPSRMARTGILALLTGTLCVLLVSLADLPAIPWIVVLALAVSSLALIAGSASSLALGQARHAVGTGTALIGVLPAAFGALAAPLVGLGGPHATLPMALTMVGAASLSAIAFFTAERGPAG